MKFLILSVLVCFYINTVTSSDCYWSTKNKYDYFSSKTPYENIRGDIRDVTVKLKGCQPISVWAMIRHGKRNPGRRFLEEMKIVLSYKESIVSSYKNGNSSLCAQDVDNLKNWEIDPSFMNISIITYEGYQEMVGVADRLKEALPELLSNLQEGEYLLQPASTPRTQSSAEAFREGLRNRNLIIDQVGQNASVADPYISCHKYVKSVLRNPNIDDIVIDYMKTKDYQDMRERVEHKLGLNFTLTHKNIVAFYDLCRYTWEGIAHKPSPWCAIFSEEDLKVLEYIGDLEHYIRNRAGLSQSGSKGGEIPLADLLKTFEQSKNGPGKKLVVYITHSSITDMMLEVLNIFKDPSPPTGTHRDVNRKWRTTFTSAFGVNMIAILYRCKHSEIMAYDHKIAFYWNEKPMLELCNEGICSWQEFGNKFNPFLNATLDFCSK